MRVGQAQDAGGVAGEDPLAAARPGQRGDAGGLTNAARAAPRRPGPRRRPTGAGSRRASPWRASRRRARRRASRPTRRGAGGPAPPRPSPCPTGARPRPRGPRRGASRRARSRGRGPPRRGRCAGAGRSAARGRGCASAGPRGGWRRPRRPPPGCRPPGTAPPPSWPAARRRCRARGRPRPPAPAGSPCRAARAARAGAGTGGRRGRRARRGGERRARGVRARRTGRLAAHGGHRAQPLLDHPDERDDAGARGVERLRALGGLERAREVVLGEQAPRLGEVRLVGALAHHGVERRLRRGRRPDRGEERLRHLAEVGEAARRLLVEGPRRHRGEGLRQAQGLRVEGGERLVHDPVDEARDGGRLEGPAPREHLVEDHPHRPHVGVVVHLRPLHELGGEVARRPQHHARLGQVRVGRLRAAEAGDAEVEDLDRPVAGQPDVGRLHVAVDDPHLVREVEAPADVHHHPDPLLEGEAVRRGHGLAEVHPLDELHGDVVRALDLAELEDRDDVRVLQPGGGPRLALEAGEGVLARRAARARRS